MNKVFQLSSAALLLLVAGCADDRGVAGPDAPSGQSPPPPTAPPTQSIDCSTLSFDATSAVDALPGGIWRGSLVDCANNLRYDFATAMISEDGRFRILGEHEHVLAGVLQTRGDLFQGQGLDFARAGIEYFSGPSTGLWVAGRVSERQALQGRWGTEWGFYGYFTFEYEQAVHERATSLAEFAGVWPLYAVYSENHVEGTWTIEADGRFDGQDDMGCLQSGQFSLVDERYSIVAVQMTVTGCALAGSYSGLAQLEDLVDWWQKSITISVDNGSQALRILMAIERP